MRCFGLFVPLLLTEEFERPLSLSFPVRKKLKIKPLYSFQTCFTIYTAHFLSGKLAFVEKKKKLSDCKKITPLWTITGQTLVACSECLALSPGISRVCYPELYDHIHTCPEPKQTHSAPETCTDVNEFVHPVCYVDAHWELSAFEGSPREVYSHQPAKIFVDCNFSPSCAPLYCKWTAELLLYAREVADKNLILNHKGPGH